MTRIYLDYAATTPLDPQIADAMCEIQKHVGNPNSIHHEGQIMRGFIDEARRNVAQIFDRAEQNVVFVPSATAANNFVLQGVVKRFKKLYAHIIPEIIISAVEHASIYEVARMLEREKEIVLTILPVDAQGSISMQELREKISERTALISIQWVNNETGIMQNIKEIAKIVASYKEQNQSVYPFFHTDAVQGIGHLPMQDCKVVDFITISAHKIYGPTGIGVLLMPQEPLIDPVLYGGGQENGWWSGTESADRIVGCAKAIVEALNNQEEQMHHYAMLRSYAKEKLQAHSAGISFYGNEENVSPHIISFRIPQVLRPDIALDLEDIAVSSGAACSQQSVAPSRVLQAMGVSATYAQESIRVSFGKQTTKKEIDVLVDAIVTVQKRSVAR